MTKRKKWRTKEKLWAKTGKYRKYKTEKKNKTKRDKNKVRLVTGHTWKGCDWFSPWRGTDSLQRPSSFPECHTVSLYTHISNFIHSRKYNISDVYETHKYLQEFCSDLLSVISKWIHTEQ